LERGGREKAGEGGKGGSGGTKGWDLWGWSYRERDMNSSVMRTKVSS